ncbi:hypothetical protein [Halarchaeum acidiphilum]|nr:hypothetical protein [Halarchaeum acidiphilum]
MSEPEVSEDEALLFLYLLEKVEADVERAFEEASESAFGDENGTFDEERWGASAGQVYTEASRRKLRQFVEHAHLDDVDDLNERLAAIRGPADAERVDEASDESAALEHALDGLIAAVDYAEDIGENELSRRIASCYQALGEAAPTDHWEDPPTCSVCGAANPMYFFGRVELPDPESDGAYEDTGERVDGHRVTRWTGDYVTYDYWECADCYESEKPKQ